ncbi:MAG: helix-turn-helix domain-containing protein [Hyphomonadaceae bacterium]
MFLFMSGNHVHKPLQERGRQSERLVLEATRRLLARRSFDDLSITDILRESGHSAGRFYARFSSKEAVFEALCQQLAETEQGAAAKEIAQWKAFDLEGRCSRFVMFCARLTTADRVLHRSILLRIWRDPRQHTRLARRFGDVGFDASIVRALLADEAVSPRSVTADVRWPIEIAIDSCRHQLLFGRFANARLSSAPVSTYLEAVAHGLASALGRVGEVRRG